MNYKEYEIITDSKSLIKDKSCNIVEISKKKIALIIDNLIYYKIFFSEYDIKNEDILILSQKIERKVNNILLEHQNISEKIILRKKNKDITLKKQETEETQYEYWYFLDILEELEVIDSFLFWIKNNKKVWSFFLKELDKIIIYLSNAWLLWYLSMELSEIRMILKRECQDKLQSKKIINEVISVLEHFSKDLYESIKVIIEKNTFEPEKDSALISWSVSMVLYKIKEIFNLIDDDFQTEIEFF